VSIADEPDVPSRIFWDRVVAADTGPHPEDCTIVAAPGSPMILTLSDGRQFVGSSRRELLAQVESCS
jgi:hypothetical protein